MTGAVLEPDQKSWRLVMMNWCLAVTILTQRDDFCHMSLLISLQVLCKEFTSKWSHNVVHVCHRMIQNTVISRNLCVQSSLEWFSLSNNCCRTSPLRFSLKDRTSPCLSLIVLERPSIFFAISSYAISIHVVSLNVNFIVYSVAAYILSLLSPPSGNRIVFLLI